MFGAFVGFYVTKKADSNVLEVKCPVTLSTVLTAEPGDLDDLIYAQFDENYMEVSDLHALLFVVL